MRKSDTNTIKVTVSRFGHEPRTLDVPEDSTVSDVLGIAGVSIEEHQQLFVEGVSAESGDILEDGDILSIVTPKQAG